MEENENITEQETEEKVQGTPQEGPVWIPTAAGGKIASDYLPEDVYMPAPPMMPGGPGAPEPPKKKKVNPVLIIAIIAACLLLLAGGIFTAVFVFRVQEIVEDNELASSRDDDEEDDDDYDYAYPNVPETDPDPDSTDPDGGDPDGGDPAVPMSGFAGDSGTVLNIYCWNEELKDLMENHYPGYQNGQIGNVTVNWTIIPDYDDAYQGALDVALANNMTAYQDDVVDIFLLESEFAPTYTDSSYTLSMDELGIDMKELNDQYRYTQDLMTDANGNVKALSWMAYPGALIYNREIATEVLGTDDPDEVQAYVSDWKSYNDLAAKVAAKGYLMTISPEEPYRAYHDNRTSAWVDNGSLCVDPHVEAWATDARNLCDKGYVGTAEQWSEEWFSGFDGNVFCYFGPTWLVDYVMIDKDVADRGGWAMCQGPEPFYWGGTWIAVANGTDNKYLAADILRKMTTDKNVMTEIAEQEKEFVNNSVVMQNMMQSSAWESPVLGGQNPVAVLSENADALRAQYITEYDYDCFWNYEQEMMRYIGGKYTYDEMLDEFRAQIALAHPEVQ